MTKVTYFGFALGDSMFSGDVKICRQSLTIEQVKTEIAQGITSCCNPSHGPTIRAMRSRFGIDVMIPSLPPQVALHPGDSVIVMGARGLPRMMDRHEYTEEEVAKASFTFSKYTVEDFSLTTDLRHINDG